MRTNVSGRAANRAAALFEDDSGAIAFSRVAYIGRVTHSAPFVAPEETPRPLVVVVDDEPLLRNLMEAALEGHYRVLLAEDGAGALRLFGGMGVESIAAVVTDIRMPGMDGLALAAALRDRGIEVPILFVSGYAVIGQAPGPTLPKPFSPDNLLAAVQQLLNSTPGSGHVH